MVSDARDARASEGGDGRIAGFSRLLGGSSPQFRSSNPIPTLFCKISYNKLEPICLMFGLIFYPNILYAKGSFLCLCRSAVQ